MAPLENPLAPPESLGPCFSYHYTTWYSPPLLPMGHPANACGTCPNDIPYQDHSSIYRGIMHSVRASLVAQTVKRLPTMLETWVQSLGQEDLLEKEMATQSSILAWKIPWTEEPGRLQSMGSQRVRHNWATSLHFYAFSKHGSFLMRRVWWGGGNIIKQDCRSPGFLEFLEFCTH